MGSPSSAGTMFWLISLGAIGAMLLARSAGYDLPLWKTLILYWPALLAMWWVFKAVDYLRFRNAPEKRPLFSSFEVTLLVLVILGATALTTAANISSEFGAIFGVGAVDLWDVTGNNFTFDQHEEARIREGSTIEIANVFGDVDIRPSDDDRILLDVKKTVRATNKDEANRLSADFTFSITGNQASYRISSNRDDVMQSEAGIPRQRFKSSLTIRVPAGSPVHVNNRTGNVEIRNVTGDVEIENRYGDIEVDNVAGKTTVSNAFGDVTIGLPLNSSFQVDAQVESGRIDSGFGALKVGEGGRQIKVAVRNGNLHVVNFVQ